MEIESNMILPGEALVLNDQDYQLSNQFTLTEDLKINATQYGEVICKKTKKSSQYGILNDPNKYIPELEDFVIGIIKQKLSEIYVVDIGAPQDAHLNVYEFEGATKKNKPNLQINQIVFCRVIDTNKYMNYKLSCISLTNKKEWMTGEAFFGELKAGLLQNIPIKYARHLMSNQDILKQIKQLCSFEAAIGINGRIWISSQSNKNTIIVMNAIKKCQNLDQFQFEAFLNQLRQHL